MSHSCIRNLDELVFGPWGNGEKFVASYAQISQQIGARKLGYGLVVVPPGKQAWPYHAHLANEEMFFVLEGEGTLRLDGQELPIRAGDFISVPPGPQSAHQIVNTSSKELKYLAVSSKEQPEVVQYPDTGKVAFFARTGSDADGKPEMLRGLYGPDATPADYWAGE